MATTRFLPAVTGLLLLAACQSPVEAPPTHRPAVVRGVLPPAGSFRAQAIAMAPVALVQAEISGPGISSPLVATAAVGSDLTFAVPFASVPLGENRPVRVVGFAANGRAVPGVVLEGWLSIRADGQDGEASLAATPVGQTYRKLWQYAAADPLAGVIAHVLSPRALQDHITGMRTRFDRDYSLIDGEAIADALLKANRSRSAFDLTAGGVSLPEPDGSQIRHPAVVRGTLWGLQGGETVTAMAVDDPLSPPVSPLPTVSGTPFRLYPVVPGLRQLTVEYAAGGEPVQRLRYSYHFVASEDTDTVIDVGLPSVSPRQVPPGGTVRLRGAFLGSNAGTASLRLSPSPVVLTVRTWEDSGIALTVPESVPVGPVALEVNGSNWGLDVEPLTVLAGPPTFESVSVSGSGTNRQLVVTGENFSLYGGDHRLTLTAADGSVTVLAPNRQGADLVAPLPAGLATGTYTVGLAIGEVAAATAPTVTL